MRAIERNCQVMLVPETDSGLPDSAGATYRFSFGPFVFSSQIDIPELREAGGAAYIAVSIRIGEVAEALTGGRQYGELCWVKEAEYLLNIPGVAWFYVANGSEVRVSPYPDAPRADLSAYLLGSVFGALCHQNGLLPLHASAVEAGGRVTAFLGDSGAGKSTLAACLHGRGRRIVSDDICLIEEAGPEMRVVPVAGWLKLWRQSLDHLGERPEERNRVFARDDKFRVYIDRDSGERNPNTDDRLKLANLVFLRRAESEDDVPRLEPMSKVETLAMMMEQTYLAYVVELTGTQARLFKQCARVLEGAKGYRLVVPWGLSRMEAVLDLLEAQLLEVQRN